MTNTEIILANYMMYEEMTLEQIQNEIKPIIQKWGAKRISEHIGVSKHGLYRYCKQLFLTMGYKPDFIVYVKILQCEKDFSREDNKKEKKVIKRRKIKNGEGNSDK